MFSGLFGVSFPYLLFIEKKKKICVLCVNGIYPVFVTVDTVGELLRCLGE